MSREVSPRVYSVYARSSAELRPSCYVLDAARSEAMAEAESLAGNPDIKSVWVEAPDEVIIFAEGEMRKTLEERALKDETT